MYKIRDDTNAYLRRSASSRLKFVYVQWVGFRMIKMPLKYYPFLLIEFLKSVSILLLLKQYIITYIGEINSMITKRVAKQ